MDSTSTIYTKQRWDAQKYSDRLIKIFLVFYSMLIKMRRLVRECTRSISLHWYEFYIDDMLDQFHSNAINRYWPDTPETSTMELSCTEKPV